MAGARTRAGYTAQRPEEVLVPGQGIVEMATERGGTFQTDCSALVDGVRIPPGEFRRRWKAGEFGYVNYGQKRRRAARKVAQASSPKKAVRSSTSRPVRRKGAQEAFQEALRGGLSSLDNSGSLPWRPNGSQGALAHRPDCPTSYGRDRAPLEQDLRDCSGCWAEHMHWTQRVGVLSRVVRAYESYLEEGFNELLAGEPAVWANTPFLLRARRSEDGSVTDWGVVSQLHGLLGVQPGPQVSKARDLAALFTAHGSESDEAEEPRLQLREAGLREREVESLLSAIERAVQRSETELSALKSVLEDPDRETLGPARLSEVLGAAIDKQLIEPVRLARPAQ